MGLRVNITWLTKMSVIMKLFMVNTKMWKCHSHTSLKNGSTALIWKITPAYKSDDELTAASKLLSMYRVCKVGKVKVKAACVQKCKIHVSV